MAGRQQPVGREAIGVPPPSGIGQPPDRVAPAETLEVISFAAALGRVARQNPRIAFANEQINEAFAQLQGRGSCGCRLFMPG